jgi:hypothetical protein
MRQNGLVVRFEDTHAWQCGGRCIECGRGATAILRNTRRGGDFYCEWCAASALADLEREYRYAAALVRRLSPGTGFVVRVWMRQDAVGVYEVNRDRIVVYPWFMKLNRRVVVHELAHARLYKRGEEAGHGLLFYEELARLLVRLQRGYLNQWPLDDLVRAEEKVYAAAKQFDLRGLVQREAERLQAEAVA